MIDLSKFDWGWMDLENSEFHKQHIISEIFSQKAYERFFEVKKGDVVLDVGASIGPFTYSILDKKPSRIICIEPSEKEHLTLENNIKGSNYEIIKKAIGPNDDKITTQRIFGFDEEIIDIDCISFPTLIKKYNINHINFLKTDCEGGEYDIFNKENIWWIKENVDVVVGEWHLNLHDVSLVEKFREFRDIYLKLFPKHEIFSVDGVNIKWDLWNEHFLEYYQHILIYIDNR